MLLEAVDLELVLFHQATGHQQLADILSLVSLGKVREQLARSWEQGATGRELVSGSRQQRAESRELVSESWELEA